MKMIKKETEQAKGADDVTLESWREERRDMEAERRLDSAGRKRQGDRLLEGKRQAAFDSSSAGHKPELEQGLAPGRAVALPGAVSSGESPLP